MFTMGGARSVPKNRYLPAAFPAPATRQLPKQTVASCAIGDPVCSGRGVLGPGGVILAHEGMEPYLSDGPLQNFLALRTPSTPLTQFPVAAWKNERALFLGRMSVEKGVWALAEALNLTGRAATLIGQGPLLQKIQQALPHCYVPG